MAVFVGLLRGINVGGKGLLAMSDLVRVCAGLGFEGVRTYIQSGNVVFASGEAESVVRKRLEEALAGQMGKPVDVMVRGAAELRAVLEANPFPDQEPAKVAVVFLAEKAASELTDSIACPGGEQVRGGRRELYIYYPEGMGRSKLKLPSKGAAAVTTVRNINTVGKLVTMAEELTDSLKRGSTKRSN